MTCRHNLYIGRGSHPYFAWNCALHSDADPSDACVLRVKLRLVGVALAGRQCGMATALTTSWRDYGYVALQRLAGHMCEGL